MRTIVFTKNYKDGNRYRLKGTELEVLAWKAEELIKEKKVAKIVYEKVETTMLVEKKETR